jgi:hypothetical protein
MVINLTGWYLPWKTQVEYEGTLMPVVAAAHFVLQRPKNSSLSATAAAAVIIIMGKKGGRISLSPPQSTPSRYTALYWEEKMKIITGKMNG